MAAPAAALTRLAVDLAGSLLLPGDPDYVTCRLPFLSRFDEVLPRAVVRCASAADVATALAFARVHRLPVAVRSGGNSFADSSSTGGLLIDVGGLRDLRMDGDQIVAGPGVLIRDLRGRLAHGNRAVSCGWCPGVAIGGALLGGGYGSMSRLYGLGCDHLLAAEVVLANGRVVWCDTDREPALFWALRGAGGGLIGVATSFVLATRPAIPATFIECRWPVRHAARVIGAWQRFAPDAPEEVNIEAGLIATHGEEPVLAVYGVSAAGTAFLDRFGPDPDDVEIRDLPGPAAALVSYPDVPDDIDISGPPWGTLPALHLARSEFFDRELPDAAIESLVDYLLASPVTDQSRDLEFIPWGGAIARMAPEATAFVHRRARFILKHTAWAMRRASDQKRRDARRWVDGSWAISHPWGSGLIYPNYPEPGRSPLDPAYHGTNLGRLHNILARYDPERTFVGSRRRKSHGHETG
jgi:hypothetical protein